MHLPTLAAMRRRRGVSDVASGGGGPPPFTITDLPNITALYEPYDTSKVFVERTSPTTPSSVAGVVGSMLDSSASVRHLSTSADSKRPILRAGVSGNYLEADGVDDNLRLAFTLAQPYTRISLWRQRAWVLNARLLDGGTVSNHFVQQITATPQVQTRLGAISTAFSPALNDWFVITEVTDGASSKAKLNNGSFTSLTNLTTPDLSGVSIFARGDGVGSYSSTDFGGLVVCSSVLSDANIAAAVTFLGAKQGLTI